MFLFCLQIETLEASATEQTRLSTDYLTAKDRLQASNSSLSQDLGELRSQLGTSQATVSHLGSDLASLQQSLSLSLVMRDRQAEELHCLRQQLDALSLPVTPPSQVTTASQTDPTVCIVPAAELLRLKARAQDSELERNKTESLLVSLRSHQR